MSKVPFIVIGAYAQVDLDIWDSQHLRVKIPKFGFISSTLASAYEAYAIVLGLMQEQKRGGGREVKHLNCPMLLLEEGGMQMNAFNTHLQIFGLLWCCGWVCVYLSAVAWLHLSSSQRKHCFLFSRLMAARSESTKQASPQITDPVATEEAQLAAEAFSVEAEAGAGAFPEVSRLSSSYWTGSIFWVKRSCWWFLSLFACLFSQVLGGTEVMVAADLNPEVGGTVAPETTIVAGKVFWSLISWAAVSFTVSANWCLCRVLC